MVSQLNRSDLADELAGEGAAPLAQPPFLMRHLRNPKRDLCICAPHETGWKPVPLRNSRTRRSALLRAPPYHFV